MIGQVQRFKHNSTIHSKQEGKRGNKRAREERYGTRDNQIIKLHLLA